MGFELMVKTSGVIPVIIWNNQELLTYTKQESEKYLNVAYTDTKEMRADKATINKLINALEDERKRLKREYLDPYNKFESEVKEAMGPLREAVSYIEKGLEEVEQTYRSERTQLMQQFYDECAGDLKGVVPFEKTVKEENYRRAINDKKLKQFYIDLFARVGEDLSNIEGLDTRYKDKILLEYAKNLSLGDALREGKRLEDLALVMEERRQRQEEQKREAQKRQEIADSKNIAPQSMPEVKGALDEKESMVQQEPVLSIDFRAWGTKEQLMGLKQYMLANEIKFGKVE